MIKKTIGLILLTVVCTQAQDLTGTPESQSGLVAHLGSGDGRHTAALPAGERCLVHGLDTDAANIQRARENILASNKYGRVSVAAYDGEQLPAGWNN